MKAKKSKISDKERVYNRILRFATIRPRSEREITLWLIRKKVNPEFFEGLFNQLKHLNLVNDREFVKWWIDQRLAFRPKSKYALTVELRQKGVSKEIIEDVLESATVDDHKIAFELARRRLARLADLKPEVRRKKLSDFLARRGFSWDVIKQALDLKDEIE